MATTMKLERILRTVTVRSSSSTRKGTRPVNARRATTLPALGGLFGGLLFALGAALLVDRADRTI